MKIEILVVDNINEKCSGMTCFEATDLIWKRLADHKHVYGVAIINGEAIKFSFSPYFRDGDIFSNNHVHRTIIKYFVPVYFASLLEMGNNTHLKDYAKKNKTGE